MLDFSKIEAGRLDLRPEPTDLEALLQEIAELLAGRAHVKGIDIAAEVGAGRAGHGDGRSRARLRQVLINLAGNGVKFTESGGVTLSRRPGRDRRTVTSRSPSRSPTPARASPPATAERLFGEFEQIDTAPTRRHGGAGLGLAISRRIVRRMGGDIDARAARRGGGSVFSLHARSAGRRERRRRPAPIDSAGRTRPRSSRPMAPSRAALASHLGDAGASGARRRYRSTRPPRSPARRPPPASRTTRCSIDARLSPDAGRGARAHPRGRRARSAGRGAHRARPPRRRRRACARPASTPISCGRCGAPRWCASSADIVAGDGGFRVDPGDARPRRRRRPAARRDQPRGAAGRGQRDQRAARARGAGRARPRGRPKCATAPPRSPRRPAEPGGFAVDPDGPAHAGPRRPRRGRAPSASSSSESGAPRAAILAVTADVLAETRAAARAAGIDAVLEKPMTPDALRRALAELTARRRRIGLSVERQAALLSLVASAGAALRLSFGCGGGAPPSPA